MFQNVLFIDDGTVRDPAFFEKSVNTSTLPVRYISQSTNKSEILSLLRTHFPDNMQISRICIVSVVQPDPTLNLFLDNQVLFSAENTEFILDMIREFQVANIDFLACNTLSFPDWTNFYDVLTKETGVVVGASDDRTGNIKFGGDWVMESTSQDIEFIYFTQGIEYYTYLLDSYSQHVAFMDTSGNILSIGVNGYGQFGNGTTSSLSTSTLQNMHVLVPLTVKYISCGDYHTVILTTDGILYGCGKSDEGQLADPMLSAHISLLQVMNNSTGCVPKMISCGSRFTAVLMTNGKIYVTGANVQGQFGDGTTSNSSSFVQYGYTYPTGVLPIYISCGTFGLYVLLTDGSILVTGYANNPNLYPSIVFISSSIPNGVVPKYVSEGFMMVYILLTDGSIWASGLPLSSNSFSKVVVSSSGILPKYIACTYTDKCIVLFTDGTIKRISTGPPVTSVSVTFSVPAGVTPQRIFAATISSSTKLFVLMSDGTVYWGAIDSNLIITKLDTVTRNICYMADTIAYDTASVTGSSFSLSIPSPSTNNPYIVTVAANNSVGAGKPYGIYL